MENTTRTATDVTAVWGAPLAAVHCAHCGEAHLVTEGETVSVCPFCFQGPVASQPAYLREEPPEQVLPYEVSERNLADVLERWLRGIWFRPTDLKASQLTQRARRYLIPLWLVDGRVEAAWRADVGFDYQVVSHQDQYRDGAGWRSQEVKETRVRWEPRAGRLNRAYENVAGPALDDHRALMARMGNFNLSRRSAYSPEAVTGAVVRIPSLEPEAAWPGVEAAFARTAEAECQEAAAADHIRDFALQAEHNDLNWTLLLLPAYVTWYKEGERVWPVLVNGQSGRVSGARRASARKANVTSAVLGALALLLFLAGGGLALLGAIAPPAAVLGGLILLIGVLLAVIAPIPAIGVWVFNRRNGLER
ncbi:MAG: hypothetical protein DRJ03_08660 [Chloroflexi bacterium]|nr:MAG: hypothetical protein DRI81_01360 [Chloroflexota bacterium]RLC86482.1 MAG: hypothetical protein DRJ03_08660 [Chloroflexota bacterium]